MVRRKHDMGASHNPTRDKSLVTPKREKPDRYPTDHFLWDSFVRWVNTGGVVSPSILNTPPDSPSCDDWILIWLVFQEGHFTFVPYTEDELKS